MSARSGQRRLFAAIQSKNIDQIQTLLEELGGYVNDKSPYDDGRTPLHEVARLGDVEILKLFVRAKHVGVNLKDNHGLTALNYALERENLEGAKILIDAGSNLNTQDNDGKTPLHRLIENKASFRVIESIFNFKTRVNLKKTNTGENPLFPAISVGNIDVVNLLINYGCDIKCVSLDGSTLLHQVAKSNVGDSHLEVAKMLLNNGLDADAKTKEENTPLYYLVEKANSRMIDLFLKHKAKVNSKNKVGEIPLFKAIEGGNLEAVRLLIDLSSNVLTISNDKSTVLHKAAIFNDANSHLQVAELLLKSRAHVNAQDKYGSTPLHYLVEKKAAVEIVELFLKHKAKVDIKDKKSKTPLFNAVESKNHEIVQVLLDHGSDVNSVNKDGLTPLQFATTLSQTDNCLSTIEVLIKNKANINVKTEFDRTPLHDMVYNKEERTVELLLSYKADVNVEDYIGEIPLFDAMRGGNHEMVQLLVDHGSDVNCINNNQSTPLILAASWTNECDNNFRIIRVLLKSGANINAQDFEGKTPLHYLVCYGNNLNTVKLLLRYNPQVNIKDKNGEIPLFSAIRNFDVNVSKLLLKNGADINALSPDGQTPLLFLLKESHYEYNILKYLLDHSDVNTIDKKGNNVLSFQISESYFKIILEHIAKLQALDLLVHPIILNAISKREEFSIYFVKCLEELILAKNTRIEDCWVTFFNLLIDNRRKLKNYAGNFGLIKEFDKSDCIKKFPIYGSMMRKNLEKGKKRRMLFDKAAGVLSNNWPIFGPSHLIIRDTLDCCLATKDLYKFCQ